jgi:DNA-binding LytR/AlgR family response regulator
MQTVKILIVEDELVVAESLKIILEGLGYEVTGMFSSGTELLRNYRPYMADMVFMDIHLADKTSGIETAIALQKTSSVPVIYITNSNDEYLRKKAIYETNAVHYLTKPFSRADISIAIDFALKVLKTYKFESIKPGEDAYLVNNSIFLKNGLGFRRIMISDIMYLKANGSYCDFTFRDKSHLFSENLSYFEEKLSFADELVRIHRSYIVNTNFIQRVHENRVWIADAEIPIGRTYRNVLTEKFRFI